MKKYILNILIIAIIFALPIGVSSCSDDDQVTVSRICVQKVDDTTTELTKVRLGDKIRIEGSGFATTKAVYCNGYEVTGINSNYITDKNIIFTVPNSVPTGYDVTDESVRNTIRIVTKHDDYTFNFTILAAAPSVTGVSHTMPREGEWIEIYGSNLKDIQTITFPGNIIATNFTVNSALTTLSVQVPEGLGDNYGAIKIEGLNGGAYTYNNFNFKPGLFIVNFTDDPADTKAYSYGSGSISGNTTTVIPTECTGPKSPDCYRSVPSTPKNILTAEEEHGGFVFSAEKAFQDVLNACATNKAITEKTSCKDLALQCDYYVNVPWTTAAFRLEINGNRSTPLPWVVSGVLTPVDFSNGWRTMTWPMSDMSAYSSLTLGDFMTQITGKNGKVYLKSGKYQDSSGNYWEGIAMDNAQLSFGNFRIVPYTKSSYNNN
jgi:hypothetical protein